MGLGMKRMCAVVGVAAAVAVMGALCFFFSLSLSLCFSLCVCMCVNQTRRREQKTDIHMYKKMHCREENGMETKNKVGKNPKF